MVEHIDHRVTTCRPLPVADVSPLPGAFSLHHPGRAGGSRAESSHLPVLYAGLRPHGTGHVRGSRLRPRAVKAAAQLLIVPVQEAVVLGMMLLSLSRVLLQEGGDLKADFTV